MHLAIPWLAMVLVAGSAFADNDGGESSPFVRPGFYIGASGVHASDIFEGEIEDIVEDSFGVPVKVDVEESWGANGRIGYRLGSWFAAEIQYEWIDPFDVDLSVGGLDVRGASLEAQTVTLNGRLIAPIWRTQPYLLIGVGGAFYDFKDNTAGSRLAIRLLCVDDLGRHVNDQTVDGLYGAAKDLQEQLDHLFTAMGVN